MTSKYYETTDLALAATLSLFFTLGHVVKESPKKSQFLFLRTPSLENVIEQYYRKELSVEPRAFFDA